MRSIRACWGFRNALPNHSHVLSGRGASENKLGLRLQRNPLCATEWTTIMHEEEYNKRQPTHTYQQPLIPTAAPVPGSIFNRRAGQNRIGADSAMDERRRMSANRPRNRPLRYPGATPLKNKNGLHLCKPLIVLVAGT